MTTLAFGAVSVAFGAVYVAIAVFLILEVVRAYVAGRRRPPYCSPAPGRRIATWEPSWERPPAFRPDREMIGALPPRFSVVRG